MPGSISQRVLQILEWDSIVGELRRRCSTAPGANAVSAMHPLPEEDARRRLRKISELKDLASQGESPDFSGVDDISAHLELAARGGVLKLAELAQVRSFILASRRIRSFLQSRRDGLASLSPELDALDPLKEISDELVPSITDEGELNMSRFPELRRIKDGIWSTRQEAEKKLNALVNSPRMEKALQERIFTTRNDRYVLLVKAGMQQSVRGSALDISSSGATLFIEPYEILPLNNRLIALATDLQIELNRIMQELSQAAGAHAGSIGGNLSVIAGLDALHAAAAFSIAVRGSEPEIAAEPMMRLYGARHPLLHLMGPEKVVANDVSLGESYRCLILSGANTGGKTVLLKTIGLCALMAMHGLHVSAGPDSALGIFRDILADIGDDQSIARSLSSYSGQIVVLREMLEKSGGGTLVLIDEIVVGTNPRQGAALAQAIMEAMITTGAKIVVTTHYTELKELASRDPRFQNASVSFDLDTLRPTYRMSAGIPGVSYALEIARTYGIDERLLARARELLDERELSFEALLEKMQRYDQEIAEERGRLEAARAELEREKSLCEERQRKLDTLIEEAKREKGILFLEDLKNYRRQITGRIKDLQGAGMREAQEAQRELKELQEKVSGRMKEDSRSRYGRAYGPFEPSRARRGLKAFIIPLEKEGVIEGLDLNDESAELVIGNSIKARYRFSDLLMKPGAGDREARGKAPGKPRAPEPAGGAIPLTVQTSYNTVDLRGLRVDEALDRMERDFDRMMRGGIRTAVVIHGHGTGALKEAVRKSLRHSGYVAGFRPGGPGEGGDGVSVVFLRE